MAPKSHATIGASAADDELPMVLTTLELIAILLTGCDDTTLEEDIMLEEDKTLTDETITADELLADENSLETLMAADDWLNAEELTTTAE